MESQHSIGAPTCHDFPRFVIISEKSQFEVGNRWRWSRFFRKRPLKGKFSKMFPKGFTTSQNHVLCANFVKFGWTEIGKVGRCLPDKKTISARSPALASARIAPKILRGQLQTTYSEFPKFHPNPNAWTSFKRAIKCLQYSAKLQLLRRVIEYISHSKRCSLSWELRWVQITLHWILLNL